MTEIDSVNTCLSTVQDPTDQFNCIRNALGYPAVIATNEIVPSTSTSTYLLLGIGFSAALLYLIVVKD